MRGTQRRFDPPIQQKVRKEAGKWQCERVWHTTCFWFNINWSLICKNVLRWGDIRVDGWAQNIELNILPAAISWGSVTPPHTHTPKQRQGLIILVLVMHRLSPECHAEMWGLTNKACYLETKGCASYWDQGKPRFSKVTISKVLRFSVRYQKKCPTDQSFFLLLHRATLCYNFTKHLAKLAGRLKAATVICHF